MRKPKKPPSMKFRFSDDSFEEMPIADLEKSRLRAIEFMRNSETVEIRERGETLEAEVAARLVAHKVTAAKRSNATNVAADARRKLGQKKAGLVTAKIARGDDPTELASDRHVRRIRKKQPPK